MSKDRTEVRARADPRLVGKAARLYYEYDLTHHEVAAILNVSRVKITRLLQQARREGVVVIRVNSDDSPFFELEVALSRTLQLSEVIVVPSFTDRTKARQALARAVASYLQRVIRDGTIVAIGLSQTVALVPDFVFDPRPTAVTFVAAVGGIRRGLAGMSPNRPIDQLAELYNGVAKHLTGPAIAGSAEIAAVLAGDPAISRTLSEATAADIVVLGLGPVAGPVALLEQGEITSTELSRVIEHGAVGDLAGRFFDHDGRAIEDEWDQRVIGLTLPQISRVPVRVVAAGGLEKTEAILAAVRGGLVSVLITDEHVAKALLETATTGPPAAVTAKS
jgi:DNA-binding transcriptional regulator LsrR (DeoR family)